MAGTEEQKPGRASVGRWRFLATALIRPKFVVAASGAVLVLLVGLECFRVLFGDNLHTVLPGKVYRSAQPDRVALVKLVHDYGIRTVLNLRGSCPDQDWYHEECQATGELGLCQENISMSAYRLPSATEMRQLVEVLDHTPYPILLHCRRGSDRTGLVVVLVLLLQEGIGLEEAFRHLSLRNGHVELGRSANLTPFLNCYREWLEGQHLAHSANLFRRWVHQEYRGGPCGSTFTRCTLPTAPLRAGQPFALNIHVRNSGSQTWRLNPLPLAGVHLRYVLFTLDGIAVGEDKIGYLDACVEPGAGVDLSVPISGVQTPGQYRLVLDMCDEQRGYFYQMGSELLELRLDIRD